MHKILVANDLYETLPPYGLPDSEYEGLLKERAEILFPGFFFVPLHVRVSSDRGNCKPQMALVESSYRSWWLVLLETGELPAERFLRQQLEVVQAARYGRDFAETLSSRSPRLDQAAVLRLVRDQIPGLFVLLGHPPLPAPTSCDPNICIGVAEVFRSASGQTAIRVNGERPEPPKERLGVCKRNSRVAPNVLTLKLLDPAQQLAELCEIEINGEVAKWSARLIDDGTYYLVPQGTVRLPVDQEIFALVRGQLGRLCLTSDN